MQNQLTEVVHKHEQTCISFNPTGFSGVPSVGPARSTPEIVKSGDWLT